jgi:hypothetical protein
LEILSANPQGKIESLENLFGPHANQVNPDCAPGIGVSKSVVEHKTCSLELIDINLVDLGCGIVANKERLI